MKKLVLSMFAIALTVSATAKSIIIPVNQLPVVSQNFLSENFSTSSVRYVEADRKEFEVKLYNGTEVEFYRNGSLKSVESSRHQALPATVLNAVPASVKATIDARFADWTLVEVKVESNKIKVELEKGRYEVELKFNKSGKLLKVDYDD